jgi:hypothetical protein
VVAGYDKAALVTAGKLKSTDGVYDIRFAHNTDATVTGLSMTKEQGWSGLVRPHDPVPGTGRDR